MTMNIPETPLTTILFHKFFFNEEPIEKGRDRLKRQCEWLRKKYTPMTLETVGNALLTGQFTKRSILITIDDALVDILEVNDIFRSFELPIAIFVCVGWCAEVSGADESQDAQLASIITKLEWYAGADKDLTIDCGRHKLNLRHAQKEIAIDQILENQNEFKPHFGHILAQLNGLTKSDSQRRVCTWHELSDLHASGTHIGCHSISHVNLGAVSPIRIGFEITMARRILVEKFGNCTVFAYPYGTPGSFSRSTTKELKTAGFQFAFLTHSDFTDEKTDPYHLPRIALPNRSISHGEFCARVAGAGMALRQTRQFFRGVWPFS
jgi:peptidoglycan/xylan/chitin deacetylase (PgdA/CDA1 family)